MLHLFVRGGTRSRSRAGVAGGRPVGVPAGSATQPRFNPVPRRQNRYHRGSRSTTSLQAFSLVEVLIALFLTMTITGIFVSTVPVARKCARLNGQYSQAISLCQHKIDQLHAVGYGRLNYQDLADAEIIDDGPTAPTTSPYAFKDVDGVDEVLLSPVTSLRLDAIGTDRIKATVTITWKNQSYEGKTSTMSLTSNILNVE